VPRTRATTLADIIRETLDGRTFYELLYAADGEALPTADT
jgi:hypothetical protein